MHDLRLFLPEDLYPAYLSIIRNISFTRREVDVMACLLSARKTSKIAYFLSIDPRTVETYIRNITLKIECNTQEAIIDFLEVSDKVSILRQHYLNLQIDFFFKNSLKELSKLTYKEKNKFACVDEENGAFPSSFVSLLKTHLKLIGITLLEHGEKHEEAHLLYVLPKNLEDPFDSCGKITSQFSKDKVLLLFTMEQEKQKLPKEFKGLKTIRMAKYESYYFYFFAIVKKVFPSLKIDSIIANFKEKYKILQKGGRSEPAQATHPLEVKKAGDFLGQIKPILQTKRGLTSAVLLLIVGLFISTAYTFFWKPENENQKHPIAVSELSIPAEPNFLERSELLSQISHGFNQQKDIQTVALIGIGGAGKTTLARWYARQQKSNVVWEINAETKESLKVSVEKLAHHLSKTLEDEQILREIREIKDSALREEKILLFVKRHLKLQSNWFLIYDNVEHFADIQAYFPQDVNVWGKGKAILTTRNITIQNNSWINRAILIGELTHQQKLGLFTKIINHGSNSPMVSTQETISFLENIPPFPLDISVAAYYIKATHISYSEYLKNITEFNQEFENMQKNILREFGSYNATRYNIITLSIKKLMETDKDFGDLLLFIGLLDSQNIPRKLLDNYKSKNIVDNFIYHLKKYSLIKTNKANNSPQEIKKFNIHRSTQEIALKYLREQLSVKPPSLVMESIAVALEKYMANAIAEMDYSITRVLINHAERFLTHSDLLTDIMRASIQTKLGGLYLFNYYLFKAKTNLEEGLKKLGKISYKNHKNISDALVYLSIMYWDLEGNYEKGRKILEQSLTILKQYSAQDSLELARTLGRLGNNYRELGYYEKAIQSLENSALIYKKYYSNDNIRIIENLFKTAYVYFEVGDYEKARDFLEQSFQLLKKYYPNHNRLFADALSFLGYSYLKLGNYKKAMEILNAAHSYGEKYYPKNTYPLAWIRVIQGMTYGELGQYEKAKNLLKYGFAIWKKHYGHKHFEIARLFRDSSRIYFLEGDLTTANSLLTQSVAIFQQHKHPEIYSCFEALAELFLKQSMHAAIKKDEKKEKVFKAKAVDYLKQTLMVLNTSFPKNSPHRTRVELKLKDLEERVKREERKVPPT